jgi:hypothetical protein
MKLCSNAWDTSRSLAEQVVATKKQAGKSGVLKTTARIGRVSLTGCCRYSQLSARVVAMLTTPARVAGAVCPGNRQ